jgi:hypothetical protein
MCGPVALSTIVSAVAKAMAKAKTEAKTQKWLFFGYILLKMSCELPMCCDPVADLLRICCGLSR